MLEVAGVLPRCGHRTVAQLAAGEAGPGLRAGRGGEGGGKPEQNANRQEEVLQELRGRAEMEEHGARRRTPGS